MIQCYDNIIQLADFLLQFDISINSNDTLKINVLPDHYGLIKVSGSDATKFLQTQLTCDINYISEQLSLGAICNIQGRVEYVFKIYKLDNDFYIQIIKEQLLPMINNLSKYILRSKIVLQEINQTKNQRHNSLLWRIQQIAQKTPEVYLTTSGKFLPHNINLIQLGAISLNKGCYKGQSIINRMHCLGKNKKELKIVSILNNEKILMPGDILNNNIIIVESVTINHNYQLALVEAPIELNENNII